MEAMVLEKYGSDLVMREIDDPSPSEDEIILRVEACGMCYTDVKIATGRLSGAVTLPHVPGHEIAGEVVEIGRRVKGVGIGDRGVAYFLIGCGDCEMCRTGRENLCFGITRLGFELPGGYARYVSLPAYNFCRFETDVPFAEMAILPDAVATPYHALNALVDIRMGQKVLIVGAGGLGLHAVQIAVGKGAVVAAADLDAGALTRAASLGAELLIDPSRDDPAGSIREFTDGRGVDVVLEGVGRRETLGWSLPSLKKGGTCIIMGYDPVDPVPISLLDMHNNQWTVRGTKVSTKQELQEVIRLVERGAIRPLVTDTVPLREANRGLDAVARHAVAGRMVISERPYENT